MSDVVSSVFHRGILVVAGNRSFMAASGSWLLVCRVSLADFAILDISMGLVLWSGEVDVFVSCCVVGSNIICGTYWPMGHSM